MMSKLRNSFRRKSSRPPRGTVDDDVDSPRRLVRLSVSGPGASRDSSTNRKGRDSRTTSAAANGVDPSVTLCPNSQWQKTSLTVMECNRTMFNRQLKCDVTFLVGRSPAAVGAHKYQLIARSPVFFRMFCGPMATTGPVHITDVEEDIFRIFLEFLYVDKVSLTSDNVTSLHYLGRKYDVEPLVQQCLEFLHARLTADTACTILEQAHCFDEHELYKTSFEFVAVNAELCLASPSLHDLCRECLERLLGLDDLEVNEGTAFSAALSWAEAALERKQEEISAKNVRCELGGALYLIRFPSMTFETLQERVLPTCVLSAEEEKAVVEYKRRQRASAAPFASLGRRRRLHRFKKVSRVRCNSRPDDAQWTAAITFTCDQDLLLHGTRLFACTRSSQVADVHISLLHQRDQLELYNSMPVYPHEFTLSLELDGVQSVDIDLPHPWELLAHEEYTLVVQAVMSTCYAGSEGMAVVTQDDVVFRFRDAQIKMNNTTVSDGQIACLLYSVR